MLSNEQIDQLSPYAKRIQIVAMGIIVGSFCFVGVMCAIAKWPEAHTRIPMLVLIAAVSGIAFYAVSFLFYAFFVSSTKVENRNDGGISSSAGVILTSTIFRYALIEAACVLNGLVFLLETGLINLFVAGLGILLMLVLFPSHQKIVDLVGGLLGK